MTVSEVEREMVTVVVIDAAAIKSIIVRPTMDHPLVPSDTVSERKNPNREKNGKTAEEKYFTCWICAMSRV